MFGLPAIRPRDPLRPSSVWTYLKWAVVLTGFRVSFSWVVEAPVGVGEAQAFWWKFKWKKKKKKKTLKSDIFPFKNVLDIKIDFEFFYRTFYT